jgi:deoxyribose-phosphate aldolase
MSIASFIDHTVLKQATSGADINKVCTEAAQFGFATVCIPPVYVAAAAEKLRGTKVGVATVIGFPFGYTYIDIKRTEAAEAVRNGATELDMVMSVGALKNGDEDYLKREVASVLEVSKKAGVLLKVIIESGILTNEEIIRCCDLYKNFEVDFLKTSTGFAEKGATVQAVQLMRQHLPSSIQIKASGGIKTLAFAKELIAAGATRLGCSASVAIINEQQPDDSGY